MIAQLQPVQKLNEYDKILEKFESLFKLRDYQIHNNQKVREAFRTYKNVFLQQPTGTGKSVQIVDITMRAIAKGHKVLIVAPNDDLIANLSSYFQKIGLMYGIIQGATKTNWNARVIIASAPTLHRRLNEFRFVPALVIHDEAKHIQATTFNKVYQHFKELDVKQLFLDATPCRLDGKGFDDVADILIVSPSVAWFIQNGYLAPYKYYSLPALAQPVKFAKKAGEYDLNQQAKVYNQPTIVGDLVTHWGNLAPGESTIVFAATIEHSKAIADEYNDRYRAQYGRDIAIHLDAKIKTNKALYKDYIDGFRSGKYLIACTVKLFDEGVDFPGVSCIQFASITASAARKKQRDGRVLRFQPGKVAKILDHVGVLELHGLPDEDVKWTLKGLEKTDKYEFRCVNCDYLFHTDYRQLRKAIEPINTMLCPECQTVAILPNKSKREEPIERIEWEHDRDTNLVLIGESAVQYRINSFVAAQRKRNETLLRTNPNSKKELKKEHLSDDEFIIDNKRFGVVIKTMKLGSVLYKDWAYLCDLCEYARRFVMQFHQLYQIFQVEKLTDEMFRVECKRKNIDRWMIDIMAQVYQDS
jgi:DNA repair protein RadD